MRILVFDSGLGGLTVFRELVRELPGADFFYVADNAGFPYGRWVSDELAARITGLMGALIDEIKPDLVVIACNTASTIALEPLREAYSIPFVGTVPAIKVAAERSKSRMFSVLATPGTVKRVYTHELIEQFAPDCNVRLLGARGLAGMAEAKLRGVAINISHLRQIIEPAFEKADGGRTDVIVLACTHYPLLMEELKAASPWPVEFIDPAPAIAKQAGRIARNVKAKSDAARNILFTSEIGGNEALKSTLQEHGFGPHSVFPGWEIDKRGISG